MCWGSLSQFFCLVMFFLLFPGERGTSFENRRLNMMNKCFVLPVWPRRLVSVVRITAMALWREERFFPGVINGELGTISSLWQCSSVIWGSHFCHIFPNHFPAMTLVGAVSTQVIFSFSLRDLESSSPRGRCLKCVWGVTPRSAVSACRPGRLGRGIPPKSGLFSWWTKIRLVNVERRWFIRGLDVHVLLLWIYGYSRRSFALLLLISFTHQQWDADAISLEKDNVILKWFSPHRWFDYGEQLRISRNRHRRIELEDDCGSVHVEKVISTTFKG